MPFILAKFCRDVSHTPFADQAPLFIGISKVNGIAAKQAYPAEGHSSTTGKE
jgi:hypothetical protein